MGVPSFKDFAAQFKPGNFWGDSGTLEEEYRDSAKNTGGIVATIRLMGMDFGQTQGKKILEGMSLVASIMKNAAPDAFIGNMATRLDSVIGTTNAVWTMAVSMPSDGVNMARNIGKIYDHWNDEAELPKQAKRIKDLFFKNIVGMGKSICTTLKFIDKEIIAIGAKEARSIGIAGSVFGIASLLNSLFDNVMRGVYFVTKEDCVRAQDAAVLAFSSVSNITYLALTILGLITLVTAGVVISPWVPIALFAFGFCMGLAGWFLERVGSDAEYVNATWPKKVVV